MIPLSLLAVLPAFSSTILPLTAEQVLERSSVVLVATVTEAVPWFDPVGTVVRTDLVLDGVEVLWPGQGAFVPERLTFTGGYLDGWESIVPGMPEWPIGARAVFFVEGDGESEACPTVGWGQGLFTVEPRTGVLVSQAGERLVLDAAGRLDRLAPAPAAHPEVRLGGTTPPPPPDQPPLTAAGLRAVLAGRRSP